MNPQVPKVHFFAPYKITLITKQIFKALILSVVYLVIILTFLKSWWIGLCLFPIYIVYAMSPMGHWFNYLGDLVATGVAVTLLILVMVGYSPFWPFGVFGLFFLALNYWKFKSFWLRVRTYRQMKKTVASINSKGGVQVLEAWIEDAWSDPKPGPAKVTFMENGRKVEMFLETGGLVDHSGPIREDSGVSDSESDSDPTIEH